MVFRLFVELWLNAFYCRVMTKDVMGKEIVVAEEEVVDEARCWDGKWEETHVVKLR